MAEARLVMVSLRPVRETFRCLSIRVPSLWREAVAKRGAERRERTIQEWCTIVVGQASESCGLRLVVEVELVGGVEKVGFNKKRNSEGQWRFKERVKVK